VPSPTSSKSPPKNSVDEATTAFTCGAGMCSSVKKAVIFSKLCNFPQPVGAKTAASVSRARSGPSHEARSAAEESRPKIDLTEANHGSPQPAKTPPHLPTLLFFGTTPMNSHTKEPTEP